MSKMNKIKEITENNSLKVLIPVFIISYLLGPFLLFLSSLALIYTLLKITKSHNYILTFLFVILDLFVFFFYQFAYLTIISHIALTLLLLKNKQNDIAIFYLILKILLFIRFLI